MEEYQRATEKRTDIEPSQVGGTSAAPLYNPCYYGNNAVHMGNAIWSYKNSNPSDRCDSSSHKCGSGYSWRASMRNLRQVACPNNNPPGGIEGWKDGYGP